MIQLVSPFYPRLGEANYSPGLEFFKPTPLLLMGGKGDEGAGLGFLEQPLLPWMAIAASGGCLGSGGNGWRGRNSDRNLDPEKVLHGLVILLFLLNMVRASGLGQSRKKTSDIDPWVSMSSYLLSFKHVDESGGEGKGVLLEREHWRPQDLVNFEGKGGGSGTGRDEPKRFDLLKPMKRVMVKRKRKVEVKVLVLEQMKAEEVKKKVKVEGKIEKLVEVWVEGEAEAVAVAVAGVEMEMEMEMEGEVAEVEAEVEVEVTRKEEVEVGTLGL
ncbi:hypothetical protein CMV_014517 [Castanea mollissima]|uniref:Uncharacterized protein n=1 Tax=Castanea mollissima TaxID=60419 RepID=A0A8J4R3L3_9ROSI|nr:hypothetical protein CMV_014517 [Castanea mollissima]